MRSANISRQTNETKIELDLVLEGSGQHQIATGVGFLDHMLTLFAVHGRFDLKIKADGDRHIDDHHTVEDVGICLGMAFDQALASRKQINRYGHFTLPMDETLATVAVDLSGRPAFVWQVSIPSEKIGTFDSELAQEFWKSVTNYAKMNCHVVLHHGQNSHHIVEAVFKAGARALRQAVAVDPTLGDSVMSSKGSLK